MIKENKINATTEFLIKVKNVASKETTAKELTKIDIPEINAVRKTSLIPLFI